MKICGYCNNEYDEKEVKCPVCGSKLLKHTKGAEAAADEYRRIEEEIKKKRRSRSMILGVCAGALVLIVLIAIISVVNYFNNPQRNIDKEAKKLYEVAVQQIKDGNFDGAIDTLDEINESWSDYNKVEGKKVEAVKGQLTNTIAQYEESGDYESIITYINKNVEDINTDPDIKDIYNESVLKYKKDVMDTVNTYVESNNYSAAMSVLTTASGIIGADEEIEMKMSDIAKQNILVTVLEYKQNGDFASAIRYINENLEIIGNNSEILIELSDCEEQFRNQTIEDAKDAYENVGYEKAVEKINSGLSVLPDDEELVKLRKKYEALAPVYLRELSPYIGELLQYDYAKDNMGNTYQNCFLTFSNKKEATYDIGMKYKTFEAVVAVTKAEVNTALFNNNYASVRIKGDGKVLYENTMLSTETKPFEISLDVSGVTDLTIEIKGKDTNLNYDNGLYVIMADAKLQSELI